VPSAVPDGVAGGVRSGWGDVLRGHDLRGPQYARADENAR